jgi:hypothetical protein
MYTYLRSQGFRTFMVAEAPYFLIAFLIANFFYKWRSFGLELIGFMVTWYVLSAVGNAVVAYIGKQRSEAGS